MDFEIGVMEVFFQLAAEVNRSVLELGNLDSGVVFVLSRYAEVLNNIIGLLSELSINGHSTLGIHL